MEMASESAYVSFFNHLRTAEAFLKKYLKYQYISTHFKS